MDVYRLIVEKLRLEVFTFCKSEFWRFLVKFSVISLKMTQKVSLFTFLCMAGMMDFVCKIDLRIVLGGPILCVFGHMGDHEVCFG